MIANVVVATPTVENTYVTAGQDVPTCELVTGDGPTFSVTDYGAIGDGKADDTEAFKNAWAQACQSTGQIPTFLVPAEKTFLLRPLTLMGPCKSSSMQFQAIHFHNSDGLRVLGLTSVNSPRNHISISACDNADVSNLHLIAPGDSPNTDGVDISASSQIHIYHSFMGTGDDCVAINGGSSFINITDVTCGPGHGISVGSLGANGARETVEHVHVKNCTFTETQNGVRIKTWEGGSGFATDITFEEIIVQNSQNPIIIDQHYCNGGHSCKAEPSAVQVSNVMYRSIRGTSASEIAINLDCSLNFPCDKISLDDVNLSPAAMGKDVTASCKNARTTTLSTKPSVTCQV
ncbi:hypothetical protein Nepgr_012678 [Nepenthes gracilis]|uniref:Polygalacturonase n=1 Tax=Nepenthes gracilis TaxID=150966 RepID=A0AAD3SGI5_NEPGR|nr:hypothetical protein Nepgr_012678 [Nepenthes gracilis]